MTFIRFSGVIFRPSPASTIFTSHNTTKANRMAEAEQTTTQYKPLCVPFKSKYPNTRRRKPCGRSAKCWGKISRSKPEGNIQRVVGLIYSLIMQSNLIKKGTCSVLCLSIKSSTGQLTQIRNHVKMYPWRRSRNARYSYLDPTKKDYTDKNNMNDFDKDKKQKKDWQKIVYKDKDNRFNAYKWNENYKSDPKEAKETATSKLSRYFQSSRDRGAAREAKPYAPTADVEGRILTLYRGSTLSGNQQPVSDEEILNLPLNTSKEFKFNLIVSCIKEFDHHMPSSYLNDVVTIRDLVEYFSTPVRGINPYAALLKQPESQLPHNLAIIAEPMRYNVESDEMFGEHNALPGLICKVPGLRSAKKFPTLNQEEFQWPDI